MTKNQVPGHERAQQEYGWEKISNRMDERVLKQAQQE